MLYFNSRPRVGGVTAYPGAHGQKEIFQFAPPRGGVTDVIPPGGVRVTISIRTPAWGVTAWRMRTSKASGYFNSHPRVGGDESGDQNDADL